MTGVALGTCQRRLAMLWFLGAGFLFFIVLFQTVFGKYGDEAEKAWNWFLPTVLPTLSLILSVLVTGALGKQAQERTVSRFLFRLTFSLSLFYLLVVALTLFVQPFTALPPLELLAQSHRWLAPLQGLVTASFGAFFVKTESGTEPPS